MNRGTDIMLMERQTQGTPLAQATDPIRPRRALRTWVARALYRRMPFIFRAIFMTLAFVRSRRVPQRLRNESANGHLAAHLANYAPERWTYGYHRVFHLVRHFRLPADPASLKVLSIGPRTEIELYYLWLFFGFAWRHLMGVDLVSSSSNIVVGDMSVRLPFPDDSFDVVVASHCLEKSQQPETTRNEIRRVAKAGAKVLVCGNRPAAVDRIRDTSVPINFFRGGVRGFIELYELRPEQIEYLDAYSPHGFEIIFEVAK